MWYRRNEQAGRMSLFLAANGLATIICSPVAYGLSGLVNPAIESWRVLYILVRHSFREPSGGPADNIVWPTYVLHRDLLRLCIARLSTEGRMAQRSTESYRCR